MVLENWFSYVENQNILTVCMENIFNTFLKKWRKKIFL